MVATFSAPDHMQGDKVIIAAGPTQKGNGQKSAHLGCSLGIIQLSKNANRRSLYSK